MLWCLRQGIGENYATIRAAACEAFEFLGLRLDTEKCLLAYCSRHQHGEFSGKGFGDHTQEDWAIAQACWHLLRG